MESTEVDRWKSGRAMSVIEGLQIASSILAIMVALIELYRLARAAPSASGDTGTRKPVYPHLPLLRTLLALGAVALLVAAAGYLLARDNVQTLGVGYEDVPGNSPEIAIIAAMAAVAAGAVGVYLGSAVTKANEGLIAFSLYIGLGIIMVMSVSALPGDAFGQAY